MPVTIKRITVPESTEDAPENIRVRDRRPNPTGPAAKELMATAAPTRKQIKAAFDEFTRPMNRMSYYLDYARWWGVCQRHSMLYRTMDKEDGKAAKGLTKQLWDAYALAMRDGVFERRWGDEPKHV